jgi:hypothetical protein
MRRIILALTLATAALAACGNAREVIDAPPAIDAPAIDAGETPIDAGIDAMVDATVDAPPPLPGQEFTGAGGRITGPTFSMDVQLGHPIGQQQVQGSTYRLEANTPIKP